MEMMPLKRYTAGFWRKWSIFGPIRQIAWGGFKPCNWHGSGRCQSSLWAITRRTFAVLLRQKNVTWRWAMTAIISDQNKSLTEIQRRWGWKALLKEICINVCDGQAWLRTWCIPWACWTFIAEFPEAFDDKPILAQDVKSRQRENGRGVYTAYRWLIFLFGKSVACTYCRGSWQ